LNNLVTKRADILLVIVPLATVVFEEIPELYDPPSRETDAYWDSLVPPGKGFVQIPNPEDYDLKPGILTQTGVERYSVAMYHELHCLVRNCQQSTLYITPNPYTT
jgi:hypothetical protein